MKENEPVRNNKRKKSNAKWGVALVLEIVILVALGVLYGKLYVDEKYSLIEVHNLDEEQLDINEGVNVDMKGYTQIALFGVDARDDNLGKGNRSDSMMVVSINNDTKEIKIVSVYRDTLLEIQKSNPSTAKCNGAYALGGPEMAIQTLNANLDLSITEYVTVNWEGLTRAIDAIGGVTVHIEENEISHLNQCLAEQIATNGIYSDGVFETGDVKLNGQQAVAYARIRHNDQGDITRTERQREVISSIIQTAKKSDLSTINKVIDEIFPYISTSITEDEMMDLAKSLLSYNMTETVGFPIQFTYYTTNSKGACIAANNLEQNVVTLHKFLFGTEGYLPTENVQRINSELEQETGVRDPGPIEIPEGTDEIKAGRK